MKGLLNTHTFARTHTHTLSRLPHLSPYEISEQLLSTQMHTKN